MKFLCQIAIYKNEELKYLEDVNGNILKSEPFEFPATANCEILEFATQEDFNNKINLISLEERLVTIENNADIRQQILSKEII